MIRNALSAEKVDPSRYLIIPIPDAVGHAVWTAFIDQVVSYYDVVYSNDRLTLQLFKEKGVEAIEVPLEARSKLSATEVRRRIATGENWKELVPSATVKVVDAILKKGRFDGLE